MKSAPPTATVFMALIALVFPNSSYAYWDFCKALLDGFATHFQGPRTRNLRALQTRAAEFKAAPLTDGQIKLNWLGQNQIALRIGTSHLVDFRKYYNPDQIVLQPDGTYSLVLRKGDKLRLMRTITGLPEEVAREIENTRILTSRAISDADYDTAKLHSSRSSVAQAFARAESRLLMQRNKGDTGMSTFYGAYSLAPPDFPFNISAGTVAHKYILEIPAERIVLWEGGSDGGRRPDTINLPAHVIAQPESYGLLEWPDCTEGEITFVGDFIPLDYVLGIHAKRSDSTGPR